MAQKPADKIQTDSLHEVYVDRAGWGGHLRYTCHDCSPGGVSATCLRQPYMTDAEWEEKLTAFKKEHPFTEAKRYPGE